MTSRRRTTTVSAAVPELPVLEAGYVACPYCSLGILATDFAPWTRRPGLMSADCACGRTVTMADATLRRRTVA